MNFIKIGDYIFAVNTIERIFISNEKNNNGVFGYFVYVITNDETIATTEHETKYQAECELDAIYKKLNAQVIYL